MFAVAIGGGLKSGAVSLFADAVDFAGDSSGKSGIVASVGRFCSGTLYRQALNRP